jgi:hypothetical protein
VHVQRGLHGQHCLERNKLQLVGRLSEYVDMPVPAVWIPLHTRHRCGLRRLLPRRRHGLSQLRLPPWIQRQRSLEQHGRFVGRQLPMYAHRPPAGSVMRRDWALVSRHGPRPAQWWRAPPAPMVRQRAGATAGLWAACHGTTPARCGLDHAQVCGRCGRRVGCIAMETNKTRPSHPLSVAVPCERYRRAMVPMRQRMRRLLDRTHRPLHCVQRV